jgi:hypothetical protein
MINRIPPVAVFIGILVCFVPKSVGQVTPTNVVQVPLEGEARPVTILLNHSIAAWKKVYGDYQTDEDNELRKNCQLRRFLLTVVFSGRPALSTRIELKSKYGMISVASKAPPPRSRCNKLAIRNSLRKWPVNFA